MVAKPANATMTPWLPRRVIGRASLAGDIDTGRICIMSHAKGYGVT